MKMQILLWFLIVWGVVLEGVAGAAPNVFILAGQSNMAGAGGLDTNLTWDGVVPPECEPDARILRLSNASKWEEAREPLHEQGVGPGMPFATSLLRRDPAIGVIGLVPCAASGSYMRSWSRDGRNYAKMLAKARAAVAEGGVLRAFLWYQGESDAGNQPDADAYRGRLRELFGNVRADLESPGLPIVEVALASGDEFKEEVRLAQLEAQQQIPNVKCVDAAGLPLNADKVHLTTPSQVRLGSMLADAYLDLSSSKTASSRT